MLIDLAPNCDKLHVNSNIEGSQCRGDIKHGVFWTFKRLLIQKKLVWNILLDRDGLWGLRAHDATMINVGFWSSVDFLIANGAVIRLVLQPEQFFIRPEPLL